MTKATPLCCNHLVLKNRTLAGDRFINSRTRSARRLIDNDKERIRATGATAALYEQKQIKQRHSLVP